MNAKSTQKIPCHRIVIKLGTSLLTGGTDKLDMDVMSDLAHQVAEIHEQGFEVLIVTSGAVAAGRSKLGLTREQTKKHNGIPFKQVMASVGQGILMHIYEELFSRHGITVAQALLTRADLTNREGYLNARGTLLALLEMRVLSIANENDVVAVEELHGARFGDNDNLSAMVANLVDADLLLILSDIAGLYTVDPHHDPEARLIPEVKRIDRKIEELVTGTTGNLGTGGMVTKIEAAKLATASGVGVLITDGRLPDVITRIAAGERLGTYFTPKKSKMESRERWMVSGLSTKGKVVVDSGCARALKKSKGSLLAVGIVDVDGKFERGDVVDVYGPEGNRCASGLTNYSAADIAKIKGAKSNGIAGVLGHDYGTEVIHRNNLVVL
ncbi:MAG: glutamate 5-kinase [Dehalococcoidales bacterium]|nr:glutamate 5-kinase [Dehalococcoidales bacterium]